MGSNRRKEGRIARPESLIIKKMFQIIKLSKWNNQKCKKMDNMYG
jgi:hypothetical protein